MLDQLDVQKEVVKLVPASVVPVASFMGMSVSDWACFMTLVYTTLQLSCLVYKLLKRFKGRNKDGV